MSQYRQKEVDAIKASEAKEFDKLDRIKELEKQLAEAKKENDTLINKNILLAEGNSILMQQLKEKNNVHK